MVVTHSVSKKEEGKPVDPFAAINDAVADVVKEGPTKWLKFSHKAADVDDKVVTCPPASLLK